MKPIFALLLTCSAVAGDAMAQELPAPDLSGTEFQPGATVEIEWPGLVDPILVWLPKNYEGGADGRRWPMAMYYHGTNGSPVLEPLWSHTDGTDWIVVGMAYRERGTFRGDQENIGAELKVNQAIRKGLGQWLRIDDQRVFVGGFSKGGWVSALLLEKDPTLAGGWIMGAGVVDETKGMIRAGREVYVGIGEIDPNRAMAERAARAFRSPVSPVCLDVWERLGHRYPEHSDFLAQWMRVAARPPEAGTDQQILSSTSEAIEWFDRELAAVRRSEEAVAERFYSLQRLGEMPYFRYLDDESKGAYRKLKDSLAGDGSMEAEFAAEKAYREILDRESRDRLLGTLVICRGDYQRLAARYPKTRYGKAAARAAERAGQLIPGQ